MYMVTVRLRRGTSCPPVEARRVADVLRAAAGPHDRLEHVYARPARHGADVVLFVLAPTRAVAERAAGALCRRARARGLAGYRLASCRAQAHGSLAGAIPRAER